MTFLLSLWRHNRNQERLWIELHLARVPWPLSITIQQEWISVSNTRIFLLPPLMTGSKTKLISQCTTHCRQSSNRNEAPLHWNRTVLSRSKCSVCLTRTEYLFLRILRLVIAFSVVGAYRDHLSAESSLHLIWCIFIGWSDRICWWHAIFQADKLQFWCFPM